jgi:hypothetical protein
MSNKKYGGLIKIIRTPMVGLSIEGALSNDPNKRFSDNALVSTSRIVHVDEVSKTFETLNSVYDYEYLNVEGNV